MSCRPASDKQIGYADSLVEYLEKEQHLHAARYTAKLEDAHPCIGHMRSLIDQMKRIREEIQEADHAT